MRAGRIDSQVETERWLHLRPLAVSSPLLYHCATSNILYNLYSSESGEQGGEDLELLEGEEGNPANINTDIQVRNLKKKKIIIIKSRFTHFVDAVGMLRKYQITIQS